MSKYIKGHVVTIGERKAKVLTIVTETTLKVKFEGECHADIVSVEDISGVESFDFKTFMR